MVLTHKINADHAPCLFRIPPGPLASGQTVKNDAPYSFTIGRDYAGPLDAAETHSLRGGSNVVVLRVGRVGRLPRFSPALAVGCLPARFGRSLLG